MRLCLVTGATLLGKVLAEVVFLELNITSVITDHAKNRIAINGGDKQLGPTIRVRSGDVVNMLVNNDICQEAEPSEFVHDYCETSIHIHGLVLDNDDRLGNLNDGVPNVTQYGIPSGMSYWYNFTVPSDVCGTFWYHSHSSVQYGDGLKGLFLIDCDKREAQIDRIIAKLENSDSSSGEILENLPEMGSGALFEEKDLALSDWYSKSSVDILRELMSEAGGSDPHVDGSTLNGDTGSVKFYVEENTAFLVLRVVNVGVSGTNVLHIDDHDFWAIETDGVMTKPRLTRTLPVAVGQRYTVVVNIRDKNPLRLVHGCGKMMGYVTKTHWILRKGQNPGADFTDRISHLPEYSVAEPYDKFEPLEGVLLPEPAQQLSLDYVFGSTPHEVFGTRMYDVNGDAMSEFMPEGVLIKGDRGIRSPIELATDQVVEIAINSIDHMRHPWHMHGHTFQVISVGESRDGPLYFNDNDSTAMKRYKQDLVRLRDKTPMTRDTINIPGHSYAVIRFRASNPGYWLLHCHVEWHMAKGLGVVFSEGDSPQVDTIQEPFIRGRSYRAPEPEQDTPETPETIETPQALGTAQNVSPSTPKWKVLTIYLSIMAVINAVIWFVWVK
ncbi:LAMI_0F01508g1_1 [Lachancea mirantina]|uniref:LAMI_0F01508g1_1 n=1 Tax=Lachancea mirantina TaxID=1230905 RepID=A0A1G4JW08_9SACH|nr:LAMI_0F01508g1_1 [Lachancea mirantina]